MSTKRMSFLKKTFVATASILVVLVVWIAARWNAPPVGIVHAPHEVNINVATLGEYPTTVKRIRLLNANREVVWEAAAQNGGAQIHGLHLKAGDNRATIEADWGAYRVIAPQHSDHFILSESMRYRIELWGGSSIWSRRSATFILD